MSRELSPVRRTARLVRLLLEGPVSQAELQELLGLSAPQLRRDLADLRAEGWHIEVYGAGRVPRTLWVSRRQAFTPAPEAPEKSSSAR